MQFDSGYLPIAECAQCCSVDFDDDCCIDDDTLSNSRTSVAAVLSAMRSENRNTELEGTPSGLGRRQTNLKRAAMSY
jgi:hypothetical protein